MSESYIYSTLPLSPNKHNFIKHFTEACIGNKNKENKLGWSHAKPSYTRLFYGYFLLINLAKMTSQNP